MSGGSLDYFYSSLESHAGDFGDMELDRLVKDLANLFYEREWFLSGDTNEGNWREARDAFKAKWFTAHGRQKTIEDCLNEIRDNVMETFGIECKCCKDCAHWTQDQRDGYAEYGNCDQHTGCLWHRAEKCEAFERRKPDAGEDR